MSKERLYFVDWLRVLVILSLVPYHAALTYTGLGDIYIKSPIKDFRIIPFLLVNFPLDNFFMTLLFFLSGIATYYAIQYRSRAEYLKERVKKVLVPFVLGTVFLCPVQAYFKGLHEGFQGGFIQFIPEFFSVKIVDYLGYAHLWFLLYLFIFSIICLPLFEKWQKDKTRLAAISALICRGNNIYLPLIFIIIVESILRPFFPGKQILIMDWANVIVYGMMLIFGFIFASDSKIQERMNPLIKPAIISVVICLLALMPVYYSWTVYQSKAFYLNYIWAFIKGIYECSVIILLIGIGKKFLNKKSTVLSYLSKASFTYYIMHLLPVSGLTYCLINKDLNIYLKYLLVVLFSYAILFVVYEMGVKRIFIKAGLGQRINHAQ